jgi:hypothetical protein
LQAGAPLSDIHHASVQAAATVWFWAAYLTATHSNGIRRCNCSASSRSAPMAAWLLCAKLRRSMLAPGRGPLAGLVKVDETEIVCRSKDDSVTGGGGRSHQGEMLIVGAVEVEDGGAHPPQPSRRLDDRSKARRTSYLPRCRDKCKHKLPELQTPDITSTLASGQKAVPVAPLESQQKPQTMHKLPETLPRPGGVNDLSLLKTPSAFLGHRCATTRRGYRSEVRVIARRGLAPAVSMRRPTQEQPKIKDAFLTVA